MNQNKPTRSFIKKHHIKPMIVWYIVLLIGIIILVWKMSDIISTFRV